MKTAPHPHECTSCLVAEHSLYLFHHAHNPVDRYLWEEEAFPEAWKEDVPIFLSNGYSTRYRRRLMEVESFENEGVAKLLKGWFVNIKVGQFSLRSRHWTSQNKVSEK